MPNEESFTGMGASPSAQQPPRYTVPGLIWLMRPSSCPEARRRAILEYIQ
jgi:hypothetical protein